MGGGDTKLLKVGGPSIEEGIPLKSGVVNSDDSGGFRGVAIDVSDFSQELTGVCIGQV